MIRTSRSEEVGFGRVEQKPGPPILVPLNNIEGVSITLLILVASLFSLSNPKG
jgi:hypothetical protein